MATLFVIATPIGNLEDITLRALRILGAVKVLACEDTRVTRRIFTRHGLPLPEQIVSYHEHNEESAGRRIMQHLEAGFDVALCSDAGTPGISDPGYRIIAAAIERGIHVDVIPGANAVATALALSGLPTSSFTFKGFPPRKTAARRRFIEEDAADDHTLVFYESPFRIYELLNDLRQILGNRRAAVCVEMTKKFEKTFRGGLGEIIKELENRTLKGEITVVVAGRNPKFQAAEEGEE